MSKDLSDIESETQRLPSKGRARLIRRLLATLEVDDEGDVEQLWLDEAERRLAAYRRGENGLRRCARDDEHIVFTRSFGWVELIASLRTPT